LIYYIYIYKKRYIILFLICGQVQDLVHLLLYPYICGLSYEPAATTAPLLPKLQVTDLWVSDCAADSEEDNDNNNEAGGKAEKEEEEEEEINSTYSEFMDPEAEKDFTRKERTLKQVESIYQWLPAKFNVAPNGVVSIESYINNLNHTHYTALYDNIAATFHLFIPLFKMVHCCMETS
jgi:hypothetical protein